MIARWYLADINEDQVISYVIDFVGTVGWSRTSDLLLHNDAASLFWRYLTMSPAINLLLLKHFFDLTYSLVIPNVVSSR